MGKLGTIDCPECGMTCRLGEHHPYAACLMFEACHDPKVVRENLAALSRAVRGLAEGEEVFVEMEWRRKAGQVTFERFGMEGAPDWVQEADRRFRGELVGSETAAPQPPAGAQPVTWQFQDRDGNWQGFLNERHRLNTIEDGSWPIRALYAHPPPSAPVGVEVKILARDVHYAIRDDGLAPASPADDAAMRNAILRVLASNLAQQPAAVDDAMVERALDAVFPPPFKRNDALRGMWRKGLTAALAAQQGGRSDD